MPGWPALHTPAPAAWMRTCQHNLLQLSLSSTRTCALCLLGQCLACLQGSTHTVRCELLSMAAAAGRRRRRARVGSHSCHALSTHIPGPNAHPSSGIKFLLSLREWCLLGLCAPGRPTRLSGQGVTSSPGVPRAPHERGPQEMPQKLSSCMQLLEFLHGPRKWRPFLSLPIPASSQRAAR